MAGFADTFFGNADQTQALGMLGAHMMAGNAPAGFQAASSLMASAPQRALQLQLLQAQLGETQAQTEERRTKVQREQEALAQAARLRAAIPGLFTQPGAATGASTSATAPAADGSTPAPQARPSASAFDIQRAIQLGMDPKMIGEYAALQNLGRPKVARTVKGVGPDGREVEYQVDEYGQKVGDGLAQYRAPLTVNQGNKEAFVDPYSLTPLASFQKFQSPDSAASTAVSWANNAETRRHNGVTERTAADAKEQGKWQYDADRGGLVNLQSGEFKPAVQGGSPIGGKDKNMTEGQAKANLFGTRMQEADKVLSQMAETGVIRPGVIKGVAESVGNIAGLGTESMGGALSDAAGSLTNWTQSPEQQQVEQAQRDFINAALRRESGASISPAEFRNANKQYFPQPNDDKDTLALKSRNRQIATQGILAEVPEGKRSKPPVAPEGTWEADKERRYQEWKARQGK